MKMTKNHFAHVFAIVGLAALPACSDATDNNTTDGVTAGDVNQTLAAALGESDDLGTLTGAVANAGLNTVFDGAGSYTLLAPTDAAFEALGEDGKTLLSEDQKPILVGILREHVLPGHMQPEDIAAAIDKANGSVTMTTLGGGEVTFTREGDALTVANAAGTTAAFTGTALAASNGVVIPIGTVLTPQ